MDFNFDVVDPVFVRSTYTDFNKSSDTEIIAAWSEAEQAAKHPNADMALKAALEAEGLPADFDLTGYIRFNPELLRAFQWPHQLVRHYLEHGIKENRKYKAESENNPGTIKIGGRSTSETFLKHLLSARSSSSRNWDAQNFPDQFNLASYISNNYDVVEEASDEDEVIEHYVEYGHDEDRIIAPPVVDQKLLADLYGLSLPSIIGRRQIPKFARNALGASIGDKIYFSEKEIFRANLFPWAQLPTLFDEDYYCAKYLPGERSRAVAIRHFCEQGFSSACDISFSYEFDEDFYWLEYFQTNNPYYETVLSHIGYEKGDERLEKNALFAHWVRFGGLAGFKPNLRLFSKKTHNISLPSSVEKVLLAAAIKLAVSPGSLVEELFSGKESAISDAVAKCDDASNLFVEIADRLSRQGQATRANHLYEKALEIDPLHARALRHRADALQRAGFLSTVAQQRKEIICKKAADDWNYLLLIEALRSSGRYYEAALMAQRAVGAFPGKVNFEKLAQDCADQAFNNAWSKGAPLALTNGYQQATTEINNHLDLYPTPDATFRKAGPIKRIAIYSNDDLPQCYFYRVEQKIEQLVQAGFAVTHYEFNKDGDKLLRDIWTTDLVIAYRVPALPHVLKTLKSIKEFGVPIVYDIDDLIFDESLFPPAIETYEGQISEKVHAELACATPLFRKAMEYADFFMASTPPLAEHIRRMFPAIPCYVHRNAMHFPHELFLKKTSARAPSDPGEPCRIFYGSGTKAHKAAFREILLPALVRVAQKHGDKVRFQLIGYFSSDEPLLEGVEDLFDYSDPHENLWDFWEDLSNSDINIAVLEDGVVTDAKSEIKWLEAALAAIPSVVTPTATYQDVITHGQNGFLARSSDDFFTWIDHLVSNPDERRAIGQRARKDAVENYALQNLADNLKEIVGDIETKIARPKKRLLIVNVFYPPQAIGGATRVVHDNVRDIKKLVGDEWDISILTTKEGGDKPYEIGWRQHEGVRVFTITAPSKPNIDKLSADPLMADPIEKCLLEIDPDLVHFHCIQRLTTVAVDVVRKLNKKYLITMHDGWWISPNQFITSPAGEDEIYDLRQYFGAGHPLHEDVASKQRAVLGADRILTVSEPFAAICRLAGLDDVVVTENGVSDIPLITRVPNQTGRVRMAHLGGTEKHKGLPRLRNVLQTSSFENISLLVIDHAMGAGEKRRELWGQTPVEIRGKVSQSEVWSLYAEIDILAAPSIWPESFGLVTREALAAGCWVLASNAGAVGECIEPGVNGFVVNMATDQELREILRGINENHVPLMTSPPQIDIRSALEQARQLVGIYDAIYASIK